MADSSARASHPGEVHSSPGARANAHQPKPAPKRGGISQACPIRRPCWARERQRQAERARGTNQQGSNDGPADRAHKDPDTRLAHSTAHHLRPKLCLVPIRRRPSVIPCHAMAPAWLARLSDDCAPKILDPISLSQRTLFRTNGQLSTHCARAWGREHTTGGRAWQYQKKIGTISSFETFAPSH